MIAKIQKWGNSKGIRIAKNVLQKVQLDVGDEVDVSVRQGAIIIKPAKKIRGRYDLRDLVARIPRDYTANEIDWGEPSGKEIW